MKVCHSYVSIFIISADEWVSPKDSEKRRTCTTNSDGAAVGGNFDTLRNSFGVGTHFQMVGLL